MEQRRGSIVWFVVGGSHGWRGGVLAVPVVLFAVACCVGVALLAAAMIDAVIVVVVAATIVTAVVIAGDANQCNAFQFILRSV